MKEIRLFLQICKLAPSLRHVRDKNLSIGQSDHLKGQPLGRHDARSTKELTSLSILCAFDTTTQQAKKQASMQV